MFAIIKFKNNQYKVEEGKNISLPNFDFNEKDKNITFDQVLLIGGDKKDEVGTPVVKNASVSAEIIENFRTDKVRVFKFRAKKRYQKTASQRQEMVRLKVIKINLK